MYIKRIYSLRHKYCIKASTPADSFKASMKKSKTLRKN